VRLQRALCALYCERIAAAVSDRRVDLNAQRGADRESVPARVSGFVRIWRLRKLRVIGVNLRILQIARGGGSGWDRDNGVGTEIGSQPISRQRDSR
jgi:hypothetical protein